MLNSIKAFFEERIARRADDTVQSAEHKARVAAAALLVEVVKADTDIGPDEKAAVLAAAQRKFGLEPGEAEALIALAEEESREAVDFYQFTSTINQAFGPEQKQRLIEELWRVALADDVIHRHEEYVIRKVADLIHVSHSAFIAAKLRVLEGRGGTQ
jgi:uncharacterized tellurite resistance protein B-like protein